jgi:hypothetical protein
MAAGLTEGSIGEIELSDSELYYDFQKLIFGDD